MTSDRRVTRRVLEWVLAFNSATDRLLEKWYKRPDSIGYYRQELDRCLRRARTAVHLGAGGKDPASMTSIDLDTRVVYAVDPTVRNLARNPNPRKIAAWGHLIPLPGGSVELIFSEYLMEHVEDPEATLAEAFRVLAPGGTLLWMAPNLWSYSGLLTHLTPTSFHFFVNRLLEPVSVRRAAADVFPTHFNINSIPRIKRLLTAAGFELEELHTIAHRPHYTKVAPLIHQAVSLLHLALDRFESLRHFRVVQVVCARKPAGGGRAGGHQA